MEPTKPIIQTTYRDVEKSDAIEELVRAEVEKLVRLYGRIVRIHLTVEKPHRHHREGAAYLASVLLDIPGTEIVTHSTVAWRDENPGPDQYVRFAVADAFRKAFRRLEEYVRQENPATARR